MNSHHTFGDGVRCLAQCRTFRRYVLPYVEWISGKIPADHSRCNPIRFGKYSGFSQISRFSVLSLISRTVERIPPPAAVLMMTACFFHEGKIRAVNHPAVCEVVKQGFHLSRNMIYISGRTEQNQPGLSLDSLKDGRHGGSTSAGLLFPRMQARHPVQM